MWAAVRAVQRSGRTLRGKPGNHECRSCADVRRVHDRTMQMADPAHDRMVTVDVDLGAQLPQFLHVAETPGVQVLRDDAGAVRHGEHCHDQRFVVGGKTRVRERRHVDRPERPVAPDPRPAVGRLDGHAHLREPLHEHDHVVEVRPAHQHVAPAHRDSRHVRGRLDPVRHDLVGRGMQRLLLHAGHRDGVRARSVDAGPHPAQHVAEIDDLGLAGGVVDHRDPLRQHRCRHDVLRGADTRELELDRGPLQPPAPAEQALRGDLELGTHLLEAPQVHVDRPPAEVVTAGQGYVDVPEPGEERADEIHGRADPVSDLERRDRCDRAGVHDLEVLSGLPGRCGDGIDAQPDGAEGVRHDAHVVDHGDVRQQVTPVREERSGHELEHGVLRPGDRHLALERTARRGDDDVVTRRGPN